MSNAFKRVEAPSCTLCILHKKSLFFSVTRKRKHYCNLLKNLVQFISSNCKEAYPMMISENEVRPVISDPSFTEECSDRHNDKNKICPSIPDLDLMEDAPDLHNILGKHLQQEREARGMTVRQLAAKAKLSYSELSRIENGKTATPSTLRKLSPYLSIPIDILLSEAGYSFQTDRNGPIYVDFDGNEISLEEKAQKIYSKNVEFFFQLDHWIEQCNNEDIDLVLKFLQIIERKNCMIEDSNDQTQAKISFLKLYNGLQSLVQAGSTL